jgi:hypothetical protein
MMAESPPNNAGGKTASGTNKRRNGEPQSDPGL